MINDESNVQQPSDKTMNEQFYRAFVTLFGFMFLFQSFVTEGGWWLGAMALALVMLSYGMFPRGKNIYKRVTLENVAKR
jgi:hypothetical protein